MSNNKDSFQYFQGLHGLGININRVENLPSLVFAGLTAVGHGIDPVTSAQISAAGLAAIASSDMSHAVQERSNLQPNLELNIFEESFLNFQKSRPLNFIWGTMVQAAPFAFMESLIHNPDWVESIIQAASQLSPNIPKMIENLNHIASHTSAVELILVPAALTFITNLAFDISITSKLRRASKKR